MALLNELLEEAARRAIELAQESDDASEAIEALTGHAEDLGQRVGEQGDATHHHFQDLAGRVEEAEHSLESLGQQAKEALDGLGTRATEVRGAVGELLEKVQNELSELETQRSQLASKLEQEVESTSTGFTQLLQQVQQLQQDAGEQLQAAGAKIEAFRQAIANARDEFQQANGRLTEAIDHLDTEAKQETEAWLHTVDQTLVSVADTVLELGNHVIEDHNQAMTAIRKKLAEETVEQMEGPIGLLEASLTALKEMCTDQEHDLADKAAEIRKKVEEALEIADRIRPVLEMADRLR